MTTAEAEESLREETEENDKKGGGGYSRAEATLTALPRKLSIMSGSLLKMNTVQLNTMINANPSISRISKRAVDLTLPPPLCTLSMVTYHAPSVQLCRMVLRRISMLNI